jgi:hypothetical protein
MSNLRSWNRLVGIVLTGGDKFPAGTDLSVLRNVKAGTGAHPASYAMGIEGVKAAMARS